MPTRKSAASPTPKRTKTTAELVATSARLRQQATRLARTMKELADRIARHASGEK